MRATELKRPLEEIRETFAAAGLTVPAKDIADVLAYIDAQGDRDIDHLMAEIKLKLDPAAHKHLLCAKHLKALRSAKFIEADFKAALEALRSDKAAEKGDVHQIAKDYGVIRINGKSRETYLESLDKYFYWALYNRDADEMAKRATPW
jgi:hypothetical protein